MIDIVKQENGYLLTKLDVSEANLNNSDKFKSGLINLLDGHNEKVVIDMSRVSYMDSSFLGALVAGLKHAISLNSDVILVGLKKDINDLFTLIRLDKVFKIHKNFEDIVVPG
ncbi:MAG: anti-sigma factor antagonist [Sphingobacteriaceae bacterium]|nr:MAG: anti-sigma factor antagonist [Sphingobacteriaceae bacterium]